MVTRLLALVVRAIMTAAHMGPSGRRAIDLSPMRPAAGTSMAALCEQRQSQDEARHNGNEQAPQAHLLHSKSEIMR